MSEANVLRFPSRRGGIEDINLASRNFSKEAMEMGLIGEEPSGKTFRFDLESVGRLGKGLQASADKVPDLVNLASKYAKEGGLEYDALMKMVAPLEDLENKKTVIWHSPGPEFKKGYTEDKWITLEKWLEENGRISEAAA